METVGTTWGSLCWSPAFLQLNIALLVQLHLVMVDDTRHDSSSSSSSGSSSSSRNDAQDEPGSIRHDGSGSGSGSSDAQDEPGSISSRLRALVDNLAGPSSSGSSSTGGASAGSQPELYPALKELWTGAGFAEATLQEWFASTLAARNTETLLRSTLKAAGAHLTPAASWG
jgi:hypothetical protein